MSRSPDYALKALADYLKAEVPELSVSDKWPDPKQALVMPALTIIAAGERGYENVFPTVHKKIEVTDNPDLIDVAYTIGQFDYQLQLDIWTDYPAKRGDIFDKVKNALNKQFINGDAPCGLSLTLTDFYDVIARFDQAGYTYLDSEESSQRSEWRVKMDLVVCHSDVTLKRESKMLDIQIQSQISDDKNVEDNNFDIEEITEI